MNEPSTLITHRLHPDDRFDSQPRAIKVDKKKSQIDKRCPTAS